jgi:hypothetical protein
MTATRDHGGRSSLSAVPGSVAPTLSGEPPEAPPMPRPLDAAPPRPLKALVMRGAAWTVAGYGASQVLRLGSNLILTRLLFPEAFGLMALVNVVLQGLQMFSDVGIGPSIIQNKRGEDPKFLNTAWTIQVFRGFALWTVCSLLALPVAIFYGEPQLLGLLPVAGLTAAIAGFNSPALFLANRRLALGRLTLLDLGTQIITLVVMVAWAWMWPSVWALLAGTLLGSVLKMVGTHVWLGGVDCKIAWEKESFRALVTFGRWVFVSTSVAFFVSNTDRLLVGKLVGVDFLAFFAIGKVLVDMGLPVECSSLRTHRLHASHTSGSGAACSRCGESSSPWCGARRCRSSCWRNPLSRFSMMTDTRLSPTWWQPWRSPRSLAASRPATAP